jgi:hypothetical protein
MNAFEPFVALCHLTIILAKILAMVYNMQKREADEFSRNIRRFEVNLDDWEEKLCAWEEAQASNTGSTFSGTSNLKLAFLAIKMLLCRVTLHVSIFSVSYTGRKY